MIGYCYSMVMGTSLNNVSNGPINTIAPVISGGSSLGNTLSSTTGTWTGLGTITYSYQWNRNGNPIRNQTNSTYEIVIADSAASITCTVTATDNTGSNSATSNFIIIDIIEE